MIRLKQILAVPVQFGADPDPFFQFNSEPDPVPHQSDTNLRPWVYKKSSGLHSEPLRLQCERLRPSTALFRASIALELTLRCGSGSSFSLYCGSGSGFPNNAYRIHADPDLQHWFKP